MHLLELSATLVFCFTTLKNKTRYQKLAYFDSMFIMNGMVHLPPRKSGSYYIPWCEWGLTMEFRLKFMICHGISESTAISESSFMFKRSNSRLTTSRLMYNDPSSPNSHTPRCKADLDACTGTILGPGSRHRSL